MNCRCSLKTTAQRCRVLAYAQQLLLSDSRQPPSAGGTQSRRSRSTLKHTAELQLLLTSPRPMRTTAAVLRLSEPLHPHQPCHGF
jgi:hypothetical protein